MNGHGIQAALIRFAIRFRGVIIALAMVLLGYGAYMLQQAKYDVFPEFAPPQVSIQTEAPGLAAEQVEILVTQPLENGLNGALGVSTIRSSSIQGLSVIVAVFDPGSDIYLDRQVIAEQLAVAAAQLPRQIRPPTMTPLTSSTSKMLGAVATVAAAPEPPIGGAAINGQTGVQLVISEQYGSDTVAVTKRVEAAIADLKPALQRDGIDLHADLFRPANFIETATSNVQSSLILGGVLVIIVLFLFLFDFRTAAISAISIPLSLLAATIVLQRFGATLNTMTLGGLAIAIGVVVDDAVIDVENIARRLRE